MCLCCCCCGCGGCCGCGCGCFVEKKVLTFVICAGKKRRRLEAEMQMDKEDRRERREAKMKGEVHQSMSGKDKSLIADNRQASTARQQKKQKREGGQLASEKLSDKRKDQKKKGRCIFLFVFVCFFGSPQQQKLIGNSSGNDIYFLFRAQLKSKKRKRKEKARKGAVKKLAMVGVLLLLKWRMPRVVNLNGMFLQKKPVQNKWV